MPKVRGGSTYEKRYSEDKIQKALRAIHDGMSKHEAAKKFEIPRSTLIFRLSNNCVKTTPGPAPVLGPDGEAELVKWINECSEKGFPRRKEDVQASVKWYLEENKLKNPFTQNMPGDGWYKRFLKRNPSLTERLPEGVTIASSSASESDIRKWFNQIHDYLKKENYLDILNDSTRIFNSDETYFMVCPETKNVLALGTRNVSEIEKGNAKLNLSVLFTFSASGATTPPMVVYPYQRLPGHVGRSVPVGWGIGVTQSGSMNADLFIDYLENIFHPYLLQNNIKVPVILFVDGHKSHVTLQVSKVCTELQIILICLYPNSTRMLQPADVGEFKSLKNEYKNCLLEHTQQNPDCAVSLEQMGPILKKAVDNFAQDGKAVINAFRVCGLYPWDPNALDYTKCLGGKKKPQNTAAGTISYQTFAEIVGEDLLNQLKSFNCEKNVTKEFSVLHELFQQFSVLPNDYQKLDMSANLILSNEPEFSAGNENKIHDQKGNDYEIPYINFS